MFKVWYSTEDSAKWIINNSELKTYDYKTSKLYESDANRPKDFHKIPTHIKNILYLDCPDIIIELNQDPVLSLEISTEAGTGHNAFQRFARIAAAVENNVPAFYIYPEAVYIQRQASERWDAINPLIYEALEKTMRIYNVPSLLYYFPSHYNCQGENKNEFQIATKGLIYDEKYPSCPNSEDDDIKEMFNAINLILQKTIHGVRPNKFLNENTIQKRRDFMIREKFTKIKGRDLDKCSPLSATETIPTEILIDHLKRFVKDDYVFTNMLESREETVVYKVNAKFRGDPYPGALSAIDYLKCRKGKTYEDRNYNLVMAWGDFKYDSNGIELSGDSNRSVEKFMGEVRKTYGNPNKVILDREYKDLEDYEIPRYFMQVRFGSTFTKRKRIRVYSYFCDAVLFPDGALWREG